MPPPASSGTRPPPRQSAPPGLDEAWKRYGSLPWATLLAPAIHLAQGPRARQRAQPRHRL